MKTFFKLILIVSFILLLAGCDEVKTFTIKNAQKADIEKTLIQYIALKRLSLIGNSIGLGVYNFVEERDKIYPSDTNRFFNVLLRQSGNDVYVKATTQGYSLDSAYFYTEGFLEELKDDGYAVVIN